MRNPLVIAVNALGITQITAWGTSFYCLGVLAKPIAAETGWATSTIFLGFSVALVTMGVTVCTLVLLQNGGVPVCAATSLITLNRPMKEGFLAFFRSAAASAGQALVVLDLRASHPWPA